MILRNLYIYLLVTICLGGSSLYGQNNAKVEALNGYVDFLNESVHGLTVAHILFVNYNKDLNKYVDITSHKLNAHITNQELGASIFDNPDINTSDNDASAISLSKSTKVESIALSTQNANSFNGLVSQIVNILNSINSLRFEIESYLSSSDLTQKENIYKSYELLEQAVSYFDDYEMLHNRLASGLRKAMPYEHEPTGFLLFEVHSASVNMIKEIRLGNLEKTDRYIARILGALEKLETKPFNREQTNLLSDINRQVKSMTSFITSHENASAAVPENYVIYGRNHYVHNHVLLSYFNSISPGFVSKMNQLSRKIDETFLAYDDRPLKLKITYPEKMQEIEAIATKQVSGVARKNISVPKASEVDLPEVPQNDYIDLEFYDPNLIDRDSISVSFNDEWILENYKLQEEPHKIRLEIDPLKGNSLFIVAKNEGIIAPNTVGVKYRYNSKGKKKSIIKNLTANTGYEYILTIDGLGGFSDK